MFILCNEKQAKKKIFKKTFKFVISDMCDINDDYSTYGRSFIPPMEMYHDYVNGDLSKKEFKKKYKKYLIKFDELYATLIILVLAYVNKKDYLIVCSDEEMEVGYAQYLMEVLNEDFGVAIVNYDKWKSKFNKEFGECPVDADQLNKAIKKYKKLIADSVDDKAYKKIKSKIKKDKKKSSKKKKSKKNKQKELDKKINKKMKKLMKDGNRNDDGVKVIKLRRLI